MSSQIRSKLLSRFDHGSPGVGGGGLGALSSGKTVSETRFPQRKRKFRNHKSFPSCEKFPGLFFQSFLSLPRSSIPATLGGILKEKTRLQGGETPKTKKDKKNTKIFPPGNIVSAKRSAPRDAKFKKILCFQSHCLLKSKIPHKSARI